MAEPLKPKRGGFLRPFGCAWFIRSFLLGEGPYGSPKIDPGIGACQSDIFHHYKNALRRITAEDAAIKDEERQAKREHRAIDPERIERLIERYLTCSSYKGRGIHLWCISVTSSDWDGWNPADTKSLPPFKITTLRVRLGSFSG